jgi:thioredoxin reductase
MDEYPAAIIGAGPAGMAAALQLKRHEVPTLLLEGDQIGGLLRNANLVENYPGFPRGISGTELVRLFEDQLQRWSVPVTYERVVQIGHNGRRFNLRTDRDTYSSRVLVYAAGTRPCELTEPEVPDRVRERFFYHVAPILDQQGRKILILGAGDAAFDYALNLARKNVVTIFNRGKRTRCLPLLKARVARHERIQYRHSHRVVALQDNGDEGVFVRYEHGERVGHTQFDYVIAAIGREPDLTMLESGLGTASRQLRARGVFYLIGDVRQDRCRQTAIAVGDGVLAAMKIAQHLEESRV